MIGDVEVGFWTTGIKLDVSASGHPNKIPLHIVRELGQIDGEIYLAATVVKGGVVGIVGLLAGVSEIDQKTVVCPAANLEGAVLHVKRKVLDVDFTLALEDNWGTPNDGSVIVHNDLS